MSGHNKWSQIKHQKGAKDQKRAALFTKILGAIAIAANDNPRPEDNPRLRTLIEKAREASVPNENIERAITRAKEQKDLKEFIFECIGPENILLIIEGITDNSNRALQQMRNLANELGCKPADPGSLLWAFEIVNKTENNVSIQTHQPKFPQTVTPLVVARLQEIIMAFEEHAEVQRVITNIEVWITK